MKTLAPFGALLLLGLAVTTSPAAPPLPDRPVRWEYAELQYRSGARAGGFPGRAKDAEGAEQPAPPPAPVLRWTTGSSEIEAKNWLELAEKLKAPAVKKDAGTVMQRIHVLNLLGGEGWELVEHQSDPTRSVVTTWMFKRRAP